MKFLSYLNEEDEQYKELTEKEVEKYLLTDYNDAWKSYKKGNVIYKGLMEPFLDSSFLWIKQQKNRKSANTLNFYTPIINEHPSWKDFPKRNVICTLNNTYADYYGVVFKIFPKNGTKIGICPSEDVWGSFSQINRKFSEGIEELLCLFMEVLGYNCSKFKQIEISSLSGVKRFCEKIENYVVQFSQKDLDDIKKNKYDKNKIYSKGALMEFNRKFSIEDFRKGKKLFDFIVNDYITPNRFKVADIASLKSNGKSEVWFDSEYIAIFRGLSLDFVEN